MYIVIGLGNPGDEYKLTRHNTGRMAADLVAEKVDGVKVVTPDTFMNKSGQAVAKVIKSKSAAKKLILIHDDLDLPLGKFKISFNRGSGGHRGVESVIRALKTEEFNRIRIGIAPTTSSGKIKKPHGEKAVEKHILGEFKKSEMDVLKKVFKKVVEAVELSAEEGVDRAMMEFN